jgi:hypothetical protein
MRYGLIAIKKETSTLTSTLFHHRVKQEESQYAIEKTVQSQYIYSLQFKPEVVWYNEHPLMVNEVKNSVAHVVAEQMEIFSCRGKAVLNP